MRTAAAGEGPPALSGDAGTLSARTWVEQGAAEAAPAGRLLLCDAAAPLRLPDDGSGWTWTGVQIGGNGAIAPARAGGLLLNLMDIDAAHEDEFNDWYDSEHLPRMAAVDGVILARRFRSEADSPRYLASYHLRDPAVIAGEAWKMAASTPWTARMRRHRTGLVRKSYVPL
ncbi:hypothetical protein ASD39_13860 [Sphingomonas sp. Root50]|nr:hypothetical protein ASD17_24060 [Sphingomonas sp. Root1294]KQY66199.1 hypothetical protein ASD39_13860 [Sphingomonas sp. Root50]KRB89871.1 hypothetical protein ASE22_18735 [Sphingomonas sp. Root720]